MVNAHGTLADVLLDAHLLGDIYPHAEKEVTLEIIELLVLPA